MSGTENFPVSPRRESRDITLPGPTGPTFLLGLEGRSGTSIPFPPPLRVLLLLDIKVTLNRPGPTPPRPRWDGVRSRETERCDVLGRTVGVTTSGVRSPSREREGQFQGCAACKDLGVSTPLDDVRHVDKRFLDLRFSQCDLSSEPPPFDPRVLRNRGRPSEWVRYPGRG